MKKTIDRLHSSDVTPAKFHKLYFLPERPVVLKQVCRDWLASENWTPDFLKKETLSGQLLKERYWYETRPGYERQAYQIPDVVTQSLSSEHSYIRETFVRIFANAKGNVTPFHNDANLLFVFSVQLKGRKKWRIVSTDTPIPKYSFTQIPFLDFNKTPDIEEISKKYDIYEFDLEEGEMLFLPHLWSHHVESLEDWNVNLNWVGTKNNHHVHTSSFTREKELLSLFSRLNRFPVGRKLVDKLGGSGIVDYLEKYAGTGLDFVNYISNDVNRSQCCLRVLSELKNIGWLLKDYRQLTAMSGIKQ